MRVKRDDDDRFRPRPGAPRSRPSPSTTRFVSRVLRANGRAGSNALPSLRASPRKASAARLGRGHVAARFAGGAITRHTRRVVIKARLVNLRRASARSTARHLQYIERSGVGPHGERGRAYGADTDEADLPTFTADSHEDRHQFRFIVSPEDAALLGDLKPFTRDLMAQMERDLGTSLTWVAVDHWDTDDPHTHIVLRGKDDRGEDLVIARDYIAHGMRARARELATQWLGPRTEVEISASLDREVSQERWTSLDHTLQRCAALDGQVRLTDMPLTDRVRLVGRLQRLRALGLAESNAAGQWSLASSHEATLRALGERGDIVRTMQRALNGASREWVVDSPAAESRSLIGRIASRGRVDEIGDRSYIVIDGLDGRAHYLPLPTSLDPAELPINGIVEVHAPERRRADQNIAAQVREGWYRPSEHLASLQGHTDAQEIVTRHVRRLEALRRVGVVDRVSPEAWRVPADFEARARQYDLRKDDGRIFSVRSALPIEQQQRALGATWLDRELLRSSPGAPIGFGAQVREALKHRADFLIEQGLAQRRGRQLVVARDLLKTLQANELTQVGQALGRKFHREFRLPAEGERVAGIYQRSLMLSSGRFALLDDGASFSLVPWRSVMESRLGQSLSGVVRQGGVSWDFNRSRSPSL